MPILMYQLLLARWEAFKDHILISANENSVVKQQLYRGYITNNGNRIGDISHIPKSKKKGIWAIYAICDMISRHP